MGPEPQAGASGGGQVRTQQLSVPIGCCTGAAREEQEVTWHEKNRAFILSIKRDILCIKNSLFQCCSVYICVVPQD